MTAIASGPSAPGFSSVSAGLDVVGDVWMLRLLGRLFMGATSWSTLSADLDISPTTLSTRLRQLSEAGCVARDDSYRLTEQGVALFPVIAAIDEWRLRWDNPDGTLQSPWDHRCGAPLRCRSVCGHCHHDVRLEDVVFRQNAVDHAHRPAAASRHFRNAQVPAVTPAPGQTGPSRILQVLGDRRASRLHAALSRGNARFEELQTWSGLHPAIVSERLRKLQLLDFAHTRLYQEAPDRYRYDSSAAARDSYPITQHLMQWADTWLYAGETPPVATLHRSCGEVLHAELTCASCGGAVRHAEVQLARPDLEPFMV